MKKEPKNKILKYISIVSYFIKKADAVWMFYLSLAITIFRSLVEAVNVLMFIPFISVVQNPDSVFDNKILHKIYIFTHAKSPLDFIIIFGFLVIAFLFINPATKLLAAYVSGYVSGQIDLRLRSKLFEMIINRDYYFFVEMHSTEIFRRMGEISYASGAIGTSLGLVVQGLMIISLISTMIYISPFKAFFVIIFLTVVYYTITKIFSKKIAAMGTESRVLSRAQNKFQGEAIGGFKEVKMLGNENELSTEFRDRVDAMRKIELNKLFVTVPPKSLIEFAIFSGLVAIIMISSKGADFEKTIPILTSYALAGYKLMPNINGLHGSYMNIRSSGSTLKLVRMEFQEMDDYYEGLQKRLDASEDIDPESIKFKKEIKLENISFIYPNTTREVLKNINLTIKKNTSVGIIGKTGSGKSTLMDVLCTLLKPQTGVVKLDDIVLLEKYEKHFRKDIGYVPQSIYLKETTLKENIALGFGEETIDMDAVIRSAKDANIHDFILTLPKKYDTLIGERGIKLSGGQRQRVAIARALFRMPQIILFDEATSALDTETEAEIIESIKNISQKVTIIMIAHRLTTLKHCDIVYKMENGEIVDSGKIDKFL